MQWLPEKNMADQDVPLSCAHESATC